MGQPHKQGPPIVAQRHGAGAELATVQVLGGEAAPAPLVFEFVKGVLGKTANGRYEPFIFEKSLNAADVEISDDLFVITKESAEAYRSEVKETLVKVDGGETNTVSVTTTDGDLFGKETTPTPVGPTSGAGKEAGQGHKPQGASMIAWSGEISPQKWMNFYTRVLAKFATGNGLKLSVKIEVAPDGGVSQQKIDETRAALRELGLNDKLE